MDPGAEIYQGFNAIGKSFIDLIYDNDIIARIFDRHIAAPNPGKPDNSSRYTGLKCRVQDVPYKGISTEKDVSD
jgi:hypothetical protein